MNRLKSFILLSLCFIMASLAGCGIHRGAQPAEREVPIPGRTEYREDNRLSSVNETLYSAFDVWRGTPYQFGGNSRNGIDCSAFTQRILDEYFNTAISRSTRGQLQEGVSVRRNQIQPGDLIFFRTQRGVLHVGIAMGGDEFLHASVSNGVMISSLSEHYWAGNYLGTRRVL
ncbi:MAG TPA: NlpC/P60 family protein [Balneolaceae bacterium]|nr:NlpC/P60 family protein [Balneolaceae bacterium]